MLWTIPLFFISFALSTLLTPAVRDAALHRGWVDKPDTSRKLHKKPIPRVGGVPIVFAYLGSLGIFLMIRGVIGTPVDKVHVAIAWSLLPAFLVFVIGLVDDLRTLKAWGKLGAEIFVALLAYLAGIQIHDFLWYPIPTYVGLPLTIVWLIGCTNAFNLIDGLDGLATGIGLIATVTTLIFGLQQGDAGLVAATAPLAGALLGFLIFNFNPASIFLGDGGSLWVGFMLACYGVIWCEKSVTTMSIIAPMMVLSIPLLDTALSISRRFLRGQAVFAADRGHIHHRLVDRGLSPRRAALLLYLAAATGAVFSLLQTAAPSAIRGLVLALFCILVWGGIRYLGYREFALAANLLRRKTLRSMLQSNYSLQSYEQSLIAAQTIEDCWSTVRAVAREFGFSYVQLKLGGYTRHEQLGICQSAQWLLDVPVSDSDYVRFKYQCDQSSTLLAISPLANLLHRSLSAKAAHLTTQIAPISAAIEGPDLSRDAAPPERSVAASAS
jgi:UDP-GlcNAc:undecaprenyl-phosphate GlcNAc-1-phosphate transferase